MKILINLSIIQSGGGLQVALSFLEELKSISKHEYSCLVSKNINDRLAGAFPDNFNFFLIHPSPSSLVHGKKSIKKISEIEEKIKPDIVFTLFGPSYWKPKAPHLCGFALAQHLYKESPYFKIVPFKEKTMLKLREAVKIRSFKKDCDYWVTETKDVANRLSEKLKVGKDRVFTVNNVYNGIFDQPEKWANEREELKRAKGFKLIAISSFHIHKNLHIIPSVIDYINASYPDFEFTFILTFDEEKFPELSEVQKQHILFLGKVDMEECPPLYQQADVLFMPTLLECFTVSYLEAMKMERPILTSDLPFAHDICQDAATYFQPLDPKDIAEKIVGLASDNAHQKELVHKGKERLKDFGTAADRAKSYIDILEKIVIDNKGMQNEAK